MKNSYKTACGNEIKLNEQTVAHLAAHPEAGQLLEEAISKIVLPCGTFLLTTVDMERVVGLNACVEIDQTQPAQFAVRTGRDVPTSVVVGVEKPATSLFTVISYKGDDGWTLITGFAGPSAPREPHDRAFDDPANAAGLAESIEFWSSHALVWEEAIMAPPYESTWTVELEKVAAQRAGK